MQPPIRLNFIVIRLIPKAVLGMRICYFFIEGRISSGPAFVVDMSTRNREGMCIAPCFYFVSPVHLLKGILVLIFYDFIDCRGAPMRIISEGDNKTKKWDDIHGSHYGFDRAEKLRGKNNHQNIIHIA